MMANLRDSDGICKGQTEKGSAAKGCIKKLKKLEENVKKFESDMLGDA